MTLSALLFSAHQFLVDRNWLQFHNPKNDAFNILIEIAELAEPFAKNEKIDDEETLREIAAEMADVLFSVLGFVSIEGICDISATIGNLLQEKGLSDTRTSYDQLYALVTRNKERLGFQKKTIHSFVLSLMSQAGKLSDLFLWCSPEESKIRAHKQQGRVDKHIASIVIHLILCAEATDLDLIKEYNQKMDLNKKKYPVSVVSASIENYHAIKDERYAQKK